MADRRARGFRLGAALLCGLAAVAWIGPALVSDPTDVDLTRTLEAPSAESWFGTDALGRDVASRVVWGARVSLNVALLAATVAMAIGVPLGAIAGSRPGWIDTAVSRAIEAMLSFPSLVLVLALSAADPVWFAGLSDVARLALLIGVTHWAAVARYLRAEFIKLRESEMVAAVRAVGVTETRVAVRHILPLALAPVLVTTAFTAGSAVGVEAALSFLGLGVSSPTATWGALLDDSREHLHRAWWLALFPGLALFVTVLACNLVGEGLRDALDPRKPGTTS